MIDSKAGIFERTDQGSNIIPLPTLNFSLLLKNKKQPLSPVVRALAKVIPKTKKQGFSLFNLGYRDTSNLL